jgi:hypothetical protein
MRDDEVLVSSVGHNTTNNESGVKQLGSGANQKTVSNAERNASKLPWFTWRRVTYLLYDFNHESLRLSDS